MCFQKKNIIEFHEHVNRSLVLDGAIGSLLQQRDVESHRVLWSSYANIVAPDKVIKVHQEYINAGADIITTNTFRSNPIAYSKASLNMSNSNFVKRSVQLTFEAVGENKNIIIAGSNPPAEDSYQSFRNVSQNEVELNHKNHIDMLYENGVDLILNETQSHFDEIEIICKHCKENMFPFIISLFAIGEGKILSGESLSEILEYISSYNPLAVAINCVSPIVFNKVVKILDREIGWGFYLNCGSGKVTDTEIFEGVTTTDYIDIIKKTYNNKPLFIGSCCGSSPKHTKAIKEFVIENYKC